MFTAVTEHDELRQGDIVEGLPVPVIDEKGWLGGLGNLKVLLSETPNPAHTNNFKGAFLGLYTGRALVLSQCCDLEKANSAGRILVAPIVSEDNDRFKSALGAAANAALEKFWETFSDAAFDPTKQKAHTQNETQFRKSWERQLEQLWSGETLGVMPIGPTTGARGVCYFDGVVSLPGSWRDALMSSVKYRMQARWRMVLQQALRDWIGRYAFPGTLAERLADGGL